MGVGQRPPQPLNWDALSASAGRVLPLAQPSSRLMGLGASRPPLPASFLALPAPPLCLLLRLKSGGAQIGDSPPQLALGGYAMFRANEHLGGAVD